MYKNIYTFPTSYQSCMKQTENQLFLKLWIELTDKKITQCIFFWWFLWGRNVNMHDKNVRCILPSLQWFMQCLGRKWGIKTSSLSNSEHKLIIQYENTAQNTAQKSAFIHWNSHQKQDKLVEHMAKQAGSWIDKTQSSAFLPYKGLNLTLFIFLQRKNKIKNHWV